MSNISCTCSSDLTDFLPIRQEFIFFTKGGGKGLRHPGWDFVHLRLPSIFEKWGGTILNLSFGGCFTKYPIFGTQKIENTFSVRRKGKLPTATLIVIPGCTCVINMGTLSQTMHRL